MDFQGELHSQCLQASSLPIMLFTAIVLKVLAGRLLTYEALTGIKIDPEILSGELAIISDAGHFSRPDVCLKNMAGFTAW